MTVLLRTLADMSVQASWIIAATVVLRFVFRNRSKKFRLALWAVVAFRLICPLSFEAPYSLGLQQQAVTGAAGLSQLKEYTVTTGSSPQSAGISVMYVVSLLKYESSNEL